jgi:hypothetical protein
MSHTHVHPTLHHHLHHTVCGPNASQAPSYSPYPVPPLNPPPLARALDTCAPPQTGDEALFTATSGPVDVIVKAKFFLGAERGDSPWHDGHTPTVNAHTRTCHCSLPPSPCQQVMKHCSRLPPGPWMLWARRTSSWVLRVREPT